MNKAFILIVLIISSEIIFGQKDNNTNVFLNADSVVFYDFGGKPEEEIISIVDKNWKLSHSVIKTATLDKIKATQFTNFIQQKKAYGSSTAACFEPHLGVVYYLKKKPIAYISICLSCNRLKSNIEIKAQLQGKQTADDGNFYYTLEGMSKNCRSEINALLIKYKFSHQLSKKQLTEKSMFE